MSQTESEFILKYKKHSIPLNRILNDEFVPLNSPIVYITKKPIAVTGKINDQSNDSFDITRVSIIQLPNKAIIKALYLTTLTTSSDSIEIITSDHDLFSDIGIENAVELLDTLGVAYDARGHTIDDPIPTIAQLIGASDGTNLIELEVVSASNPALKIGIVDNVNGARVLGEQGDSIPVETAMLFTKNFGYEFNGTTWDRIRSYFTQVTGGLVANGVGGSLNLITTPMSKFSLAVGLSVGSSPYVVELQGEVNGIGFVTLATLSSSGNPDMIHVIDKPCTAIRYEITTIGAGNTMSIGLLAVPR